MLNNHSGLATGWVCVSCEGATADGRYIDAEWLTGMASSYDPEFYTALLWEEHDRTRPNLGEVVELEAKSVAGEMRLYARLKPTVRLMEYNRNGQKLFCSVEVEENFAQTGCFYLGGLAVTDSPASINTERLHFRRQRHFNRPASRPAVSKPLALDLSGLKQPVGKGWFAAITSG